MRVGCLFLLLAACGADPEPTPESQPQRPDVPPDAPLVVFFGDSITAGIHLAERDAFPAIVQRALLEAGKPIRVINAGNSGETSAGGLRRIDWLLKQEPAIVVVELGGNDGLRGISLDEMRANLETMVDLALEREARVLLVGVRLPPNYGPLYIDAFAAVFREVARTRGVPLVPRFLDGVGGDDGLMQEDGIHPTVEAQPRLLENVWPALAPLL